MKTTAFFLSIVFMLFSCTKDKETETQDQLPRITEVGANIAGFLLNGKVIVPKNGIEAFGTGPNYGLAINQGNIFWPNKNDFWQLEIANKKDGKSASIFLWIKNMSTGNGDYVIGQSNGQLYSGGPNNNQIIAFSDVDNVNKVYYSSLNSGSIKITRSDLGYGIAIYSGIFNATLYNRDNPTEKIQITDGRFDINGLTLNK